ncbi:DegT/DnrJ/EryC1/StrS family aminotransferase [Mesoflavibacter sp. SCSIO 43206]|uniref:DegT/DnrJ/EryC1/StrS family aminotransferase n=1 Tax=Mesoflavibacter sp. SCSIO 43206 TaxID=2779362 RepID=UPI00351CCF27
MKKDNYIWLSPPDMDGKELSYIEEAFTTNWLTTSGNNINAFETEMQTFLNTKKEVVMLNSGTSAIHLALIQLGVKEGDEVLCQSLTFVGSVNPILYQKANPIFIDSEPETYNLCPKLLEEAIIDRLHKGKQPKAIIVVHLYGVPAKMDHIITISKKYNIPIIEDAAEALGATYKKQHCGTLTDFGIFSFNGNKIITTTSGGALICNNKKLKAQAVKLATQSKENEQFYQHKQIGYNYRISNVLAGIGRGQLKSLNAKLLALKANHLFYKQLFASSVNIELVSKYNPNIQPNYWLNYIRVRKESKRTNFEILKHLEARGIQARPIWKPMHLQPLFKNNKFYGNHVAEDLYQNGLCLPSGSNLTLSDKKRIKEALHLFL